MKITDAISDSMLEDKFFGLHGNAITYKAFPTRPVDGVKGINHFAPQVLRFSKDGTAYPHSFTIGEILDVSWEIRENAGVLVVDKPVYHGIINCSADVLETITDLFGKEGYGIIDSSQDNPVTGGTTLYCRSHLFLPNVAGAGTPNYVLKYEEDTRTLTAHVFSV
jgi:hypothetical protein